MHASPLQGVLDHLRKLTDPARVRELSDADLLERFRLRREEAAFALLVQRHGPMVLAVCRRVLGDAHEAEDAFQATFLVLVRKASTIRTEASLSSWLHVVATHLAQKARMRSLRQRDCVGQAFQPDIRDDPSDTLAAAELRAALDEEIERLPAKYRTPLVLCYLADKTHEQTAKELGWPKSSVTARLAKARQLLQQRLIRRGFTASAGLLATLLTEQTANAGVPSLLTLSTVRLAVGGLTGKTLAATTAAVLADTFAKGSVVGKWTAALALLATLGLGAVVGTRMVAVGPPSKREERPLKTQAVGNPRGSKAEVRKPRLDLQGDPLPDEVVARMGSGRLRHSGGVTSLAFAPSGTMLVSDGDGGLHIWDAKTGKILRRFHGDSASGKTSFLFTPDGIAYAVPEKEGVITVQLVNAATGQVPRRVRIKEPAIYPNPIFSLDGKRIAFACKNGIGLCDTTTGEMALRIPVKGIAAWDIAFAPDGKTLAFNDLSDTIYVHDAVTGKLVRELKHPGETTTHLVFSPDGRFLASMPQSRITEKGEVSIWNWRDGKEVHHWTHPFAHAVSAAFSADGKLVAIGSGRWGLVLWDVETGKEVRRLSPHGGVYGIAFSPDGKTLATASPFGAIRLWDARTGKIRPTSADANVQLVGCLRFSADGKRLFGDAGTCLVWDASTGREVRRLDDPEEFDFKLPNDMRHLFLSPDESLLAAANPDGTINLWDAATGKKKHVLKGHNRFLYKIMFSPDSRKLISNGSDQSIRVWDVASGRELHQLHGQTPLAVSPDNRLLATTEAKKPNIIVYDLAAGREMKRFALATEGNVLQMAFSADSRVLAAAGSPRRSGGSGGKGAVKVWDIDSGRLLRAMESPKTVLWSVTISPDGRSVTTGDSFGSLVLWELASGRQRHTFVGHQSRIASLAFSRDGRTLAASSVDAPVFVWDVAGILEPRPRPLSNDELQRCWTALAGEDASAAFQALRRLAAAPEQTVPYLREHLKSVPAPDLKRVRQLVDMLDSADFSTRQKAAEELEKQADAAAGLLRQIVAKEKPSLEVRRRLQQILEGIESKPECLRAVRAVEVLEGTATPDAVRLIDKLAKGAAESRLTREASAAKRRLSR